MSIPKADLELLKSHTASLMNHVFYFKQQFDLHPVKEHIGTCINYVDISESKSEFCDELVNTICEWVYNRTKTKEIIADMIKEGRSEINANSSFRTYSFRKFRNRDSRELVSQGQFGELLLFNFLQFFFDAVPFVRKMPITTSVGMERYGADAIHYTQIEGVHRLYLGEAKTYTSKYNFNAAFEDGLESIVKTYNEHRKEINLYIYDDFIDPQLQRIATQYKNGSLKNVEIHLVLVVTYNETMKISDASEKEIKSRMMQVIEERCREFNKDLFKAIDSKLLPRFNYIIFPVWRLDELIASFQKLIGI